MKMKSLAILAMSGVLLAASVAYVAPAMADDTSNAGQSMQQTPSQAPSSDNSMQNQGQDQSQSNTGSQGDMNNNSSDQGSPDTATGDDDY